MLRSSQVRVARAYSQKRTRSSTHFTRCESTNVSQTLLVRCFVNFWVCRCRVVEWKFYLRCHSSASERTGDILCKKMIMLTMGKYLMRCLADLDFVSQFSAHQNTDWPKILVTTFDFSAKALIFFHESHHVMTVNTRHFRRQFSSFSNCLLFYFKFTI